jgi:hypothetical protein
MRRSAALLAAACLGAACGGSATGPAADVEAGVGVVSSPAVEEFYRLASSFYEHLERRRFNTLAAFRDPVLRQHFRNDRAFSDYYADLAQALAEAHFERSRPLETEVEEFLVDGPGRARVRVRLVGESGLPLRWWTTHVVREDRWERRDDRWWIVPGRL